MSKEAKKVGRLSTANRGELKGYYNAVPTVKLGILTDDLVYQLYSDTDQENLMDDELFAIVNLTEVAQEQIADDAFDALLNVRRDTFNPEDIGADARRKVYMALQALHLKPRLHKKYVICTISPFVGHLALHQNLTSMLPFGATADPAPKVG